MVRLKGFASLKPVDEALEELFDRLKPRVLEPELIPLKDSLKRVAAENVIAERDAPPFERSAMDGYAVRASDTFGASEQNPKKLRLVKGKSVSSGRAVKVWTGAPLPRGADAVVMLEYVREMDEKIEIIVQVTPGEDVSPKGEDIRRGEIAVREGTRIRPEDIGLLTALGFKEVKVVRKPRVGILSTGSELVEPGTPLKPGKIINVNRLVLSNMVLELGGEPVDLGIVKDDLKKIARRISAGLQRVDILLTTGGTSVGGADLVPDAVNSLGEPGLIVHGVTIRPGKPTGIAVVKKKPVILLSGYPVAAMFGFETFVRPLILRMLGVPHEKRHSIKAKLTRKVASTLGVRVYLRVRVYEKNGELFADLLGTHGSGILTSMTKATGYVIIPEERDKLEKGELVAVNVTGPIWEK